MFRLILEKRPNFRISMLEKPQMKKFMSELALKIVDRIQTNVEDQVIWDGSTVDENSEFTKAIKNELGLVLKSLMFEELSFLNDGSYTIKYNDSDNSIEIELNDYLSAKAKHQSLQETIPNKNYYKFFPELDEQKDLSIMEELVSDEIENYINDFIQNKFDKGSK